MASHFDTLFTQSAADRDAVRYFYAPRSPHFSEERDRRLRADPLTPDPDVDLVLQTARDTPGEPPRPTPDPAPPRKPVMAPDLFKQRAGAIASDRGKPIAERIAALQQLAETGGYSVPIEDLERVVQHGIATLDFRAGPDGAPHRLTPIRVRPPDPAPAAARPGTERLEPGVKIDPLMHGTNKLALKLINAPRPEAGRIAAQLATHVRRQAGQEVRSDAWFAGLVPDIEKAIRWRREHGGRPYNGYVSLETTTDPAPIPTPPRIAEAHMREMLLESKMPGHAIYEAPPPRTLGEKAEEAAFRLHRALGDRSGVARHRAEQLRTVIEWTPVLGGIDLLQHGGRDLENGRVGEGVGNVLLGALDFGLPVVRKGGKLVLGGADLRRMTEKIGSATEIDRAVATKADELLESGARILVHTPEGSHRITGPNLTDESGRSWTAQDILAGEEKIRLEIGFDHGRDAAVAAAARNAYSLPTAHRGDEALDPEDLGVAGRTFRSRTGASIWAKSKGLDLTATHALESRGKRFVVVERGPPELENIVARAEEAQRELARFGARHPAEFHEPGVKSRARILEKVANEDYSGPADLKDLARGAFVARSIEHAEEIAASIRKRFPIDEDKGWKLNPDTGYLDHKLIVRFANGTRGEIQIVPEPIWRVKDQTHALYKTVRTTEDDASRVASNRRQLEINNSAIAGTEFSALGRAPTPVPPSAGSEAHLSEKALAGESTLGRRPQPGGKGFKSHRAAEAWARSNGIDLQGRHAVEKRGGRYVIVDRDEGGSTP